MSNILRDGIEWLAEQLDANVSVPCFFVRGENVLPINAVLGHQLLRVSDNQGNVKTERTDRDFMVTAAEFTFDGSTLIIPQRGDYWIVDLGDGAGPKRYDVMPIGGEAPWRYSDPFHTRIRMHTKFVGSQDVPVTGGNWAGDEFQFAGDDTRQAGGRMIQAIDIGTAPTGSDGDTVREASTKTNALLSVLVSATGTVVMSAGVPSVVADPSSIAGSYTSANITVDAHGRIIAAANGSGGGSFTPPYLDVVNDYLASGSNVTRVGTITSGSTTLHVDSAATFAVGQGIFVLGTGASGANLVTTITAISGTTITLANAAGTSVSGVLTMHDDTVAINAALADAVAAHGQVVGFRDGHYRCSGPFIARTNSILTIPNHLPGGTAVGILPTVKMLGLTTKAQCQYDSTSLTLGYGGGVLLDFTHSPAGVSHFTGDLPAAISGALEAIPSFPIVDTDWNVICFEIDNISIALPGNPTFSAIQMSNIWQMIVGDQVCVGTAFDPASGPIEPINTSLGIRYPRGLNNVKLVCGACTVFGFYIGIMTGEHLELRNPYIAVNRHGLYIEADLHPVFGRAQLENNVYHLSFEQGNFFVSDNSVGSCVMLQIEVENAASGWYANANTINDPGNFGKGVVEASIFAGGGALGTFTKSGGAHLTLIDRHDMPPVQTFTMDGTTGTLTIQLPKTLNDCEITIDGMGTDGSLQAIDMQFNGDSAGHYDWADVFALHTAPAYADDTTGTQTSGLVGLILSASGSVANLPSMTKITIPGYRNSTFKKRYLSHCVGLDNAASTTVSQGRLDYITGSWHSTAPIDSATLVLSAGNFTAGSRITVRCW